MLWQELMRPVFRKAPCCAATSLPPPLMLLSPLLSLLVALQRMQEMWQLLLCPGASRGTTDQPVWAVPARCTADAASAAETCAGPALLTAIQDLSSALCCSSRCGTALKAAGSAAPSPYCPNPMA